MPKDKNPQSDADQTDLSLTAIIKALDSGNPMPDDQSQKSKDPFDPNATLDYKQAGVDFPEFPFADEKNADEAKKGGSTKQSTSSKKSSGSKKGSAQKKKADAKKADATAADDALILDDVDEAAPPPKKPSSTGTRKPKRDTPGSRSQATSSDNPHDSAALASARTFTGERAPRAAMGIETRTSRTPSYLEDSGYDSIASGYQPVTVARSSYKIRGGGGNGLSARSPVLIIATIVLVAAGVFILYYALNNVLGGLTGGSQGTDFELTTTETREAIDSHIPVLVDFVDTSIEDTAAVITSWGQFVYTNDRYQPDSPDLNAEGSELVSMPAEMTEEQMSGYYGGSYNAYTPEELVAYFNGSYTLDMAYGELGSWNKLKYVNFNATSIDDEMTHLAALQGLSGDTVTISAQGVDTRGNKVIQGQKVVDGERVLYFKIAACPFNDIYNAKSVSDSSVYISCTLASYDFFTGSDEITPE